MRGFGFVLALLAGWLRRLEATDHLGFRAAFSSSPRSRSFSRWRDFHRDNARSYGAKEIIPVAARPGALTPAHRPGSAGPAWGLAPASVRWPPAPAAATATLAARAVGFRRRQLRRILKPAPAEADSLFTEAAPSPAGHTPIHRRSRPDRMLGEGACTARRTSRVRRSASTDFYSRRSPRAGFAGCARSAPLTRRSSCWSYSSRARTAPGARGLRYSMIFKDVVNTR